MIPDNHEIVNILPIGYGGHIHMSDKHLDERKAIDELVYYESM